MWDNLFPAERDASIAQLMQRPTPEPEAPGIWQGYGSALADVIPHAAKTTGSFFAAMLDAYGKSAAYANAPTVAMMHGEPLPDPAKLKAETIDKLGDSQLAREFRESAKQNVPDPASVGIAGQITHGILSTLGKAGLYSLTAGPFAPAMFGADLGVNRAQELTDQGVDGWTAAKAGALTAVTNAAGLRIPAAMGATRLQSAAIGAAVNPALNVVDVGATRALLQNADYDAIAQQYQPLDSTNLAIAAITGSLFGGIFHTGRAKPGESGKPGKPLLTPEEHAAVLTMHEVNVRADDTLTRPGDMAGSNAGADAQLLARAQLDAGEPVSVALDVPTDPEIVRAKAAEIMSRLNENGALIGRPLDFGGRSIEHLETEYARLTDAEGKNPTDGGHVIDTDMVRELSPEYRQNRLRSADIHDEASRVTKELYARALARPVAEGRDNAVLFLAGGGGSGKSTVRRNLLGKNGADITVDGTFSNLARARRDVRAALDSGRNVDIFYVYRSPENAAPSFIDRAIHEGRPVPVDVLAEAHANAPEVVRALAEEYNGDSRVRIRAAWNDGLESEVRSLPIEEIPHVNRTHAEAVFRSAVDAAAASDRIEPALYRAFTSVQDIRRIGVRGSESGQAGVHRTQGSVADENPTAFDDAYAAGKIPERLYLVSRGKVGALGTQSAGGGKSGQPRQSGTGSEGGVSAPDSSLPAHRFPVQGNTAAAVTERGQTVPVRYAVAEAGDLVTSHGDTLNVNPDFPAELQPRDRSRAASEAQIARIENSLNPELLAESPKASDGAPIVGRDGVVESGNARTIALRRAYGSGKADAYRQWLIDNAARFGLNPENIAAMKNPVLTRVGLGEYNRAEFARQANESAVAHLSVTEQAKADVQRMPDLAQLATNEDGSINIGQSLPFIRAFMADAVSPSEHGAMVTADGALSQQGLQRIRNAIFQKAYGDPDLVAMLSESTDANVKNILAGMLRAAPEMARLKDLMDAGARYPLDVSGDLARAVRLFSQLRQEKTTVAQLLAQHSLFDSDLSPTLKNLLVGLEENAKAPKRISEMIGRMVDAVDRLGDPNQGALFGGDALPGMDRLASNAIESVRRDFEVKPSGDLFAKPDTPEQARAFDAAAKNPDVPIQTVDADGNEVRVRAADLAQHAEAIERQSKADSNAFESAINCVLRFPR